MDFNIVVQFYEKIAATKKRLEIIDILGQLFTACKNKHKVSKSEFAKIIYLTQGRLVSEIDEWPKFGIAEKMIIQALVVSTSKSASIIKQKINEKGDVGEAVEFLLQKKKTQKISYSLDAFAPKKKSSQKKLEIPTLYSELEKLSNIKGDGSQDQKISVINGILRRSTPESAKYIINIILSNLRIGLADKTIMDSLAVAYTGSKENRLFIENTYNIFPDLGKIASILMDEGLEKIKKTRIQVGIPIRMMLASRIQYSQIQKKLGGKEFIAEYKYDGERVQVHKAGKKISLFSRQLKNITDQYPDVVNAIKSQITVENVILEGEIVAMDPFFEQMLPFQVMSQRRRKYDITKMIKEVPVCLFCFDVLYIDKKLKLAKKPKKGMEMWLATDKQKKIDNNYKTNTENDIDIATVESKDITNESDLTKLSIIDRRKNLESLFTPIETLRFSQMKIIRTTDEMVEYFNEARSKGAEGIINKSMGTDSSYSAGKRGFLWIKLKGLEGAKMTDTIDVVIIGGSWGKGRRAGILSTLFGAVFNEDENRFEFFTKVGSGFSDEDLDHFTQKIKKLELKKYPPTIICKDTPDILVKPEIIIEIMGDELTVSNKSDAGSTLDDPNGYSLRFPIYQRTREDKNINQITTTAEIIEMFNIQSDS
jgi:DNA ligase 1